MYSRAIFSSLLRVSGMAASSASSEQQRAYFSKSFPICEGISVDLHCIVMNFFDSTLFQRERRVSLGSFSSMDRATNFRRRARRCKERASVATEPERREHWKRAANAWHSAADAAERTPPLIWQWERERWRDGKE